MYSSPLFKEGWLSASGTISASSSSTLQLKFDRFWLDIGNTSLRQDDPGNIRPFAENKQWRDRFIDGAQWQGSATLM